MSNVEYSKLLASLNNEEKELALSILNEIKETGQSKAYNDLILDDYKEIPVDIETFLKDKQYLGSGLTNSEGKFTVFPYWVETLKKIFPDNLTTRYNTLVLTGAIGLGKSLVAVLCELYMLYRMLCLKDPYLHYGLQPIDKISFSLINTSLDTAKGVAWDKMQQLLQSSPWFMARGKITGREDLKWKPQKGIELIVGSRNNHVIGRAIFCLDGETEILTSQGNKKIKNLVGKKIAVVSMNEVGTKFFSQTCTVEKTLKTANEYVLELEDSTIIKCTETHRFLLPDNTYKEARDLKNDDTIVLCNANPVDDSKFNIKIKTIYSHILKKEKQYYDVIDAKPYNNFLVKVNSGFIVSHNCNFTDEVNFSAITSDIDKIKKKQRTLISQVDARMQSRFMRNGKLPTLNIIASSKNNEQSFLESYIDMKVRNESKTTLVIDEPQWVVRPEKQSKEKFYVALGNKFLASEVLPLGTTKEEAATYKDKGYELLEVPIGYYEAFNDNVDIALTDIAGISTISALKYISGVRWKEIKTNSYRNPFSKDIIEVGNALEDTAQYGDFFDLSAVPADFMAKPMYIHLDMSKSGDKTGISGVWVLGKHPTIPGQDASKELFYRVAFSVSIKAPKGYEISFEKNRNFIRWLREQGFNIKGVSSDTYQSAQIQQQLQADGFNAKIISVDRLESVDGTKQKICVPYQYFKSTVYERRLEVYEKCDLLTDEVLGLEREPDGHINHPENGAVGSKDSIDAIVGAMYNASLHVDEFSYDYGETLQQLLDINKKDGDIKTQITVDFEKELQKIDFCPKNANSIGTNELGLKSSNYYDDIILI